MPASISNWSSGVLVVPYLFLATLALVLGRQAGCATMAWICLGFAFLITMVFGGFFAINLCSVCGSSMALGASGDPGLLTDGKCCLVGWGAPLADSL